ncbi:uncharacterized protein LOC118339109 [Morone saxatilis]|uniref:uncharacterized protein LOC118339109 n=1 Tax=Morone saxatilis TaxID=34816 RepID=UPI0015E1E568|nr:uncharacterized protein LOC118339109 [Morone saxatilis]
MTVHTMCHNPSLPLEGVDSRLLLNFTSRECHMVPQPADDGAMMVCGCHGEQECNDRLIFDKGANGFSKLQSKDVIPVVVVSLVPPVLVAIVATAAFYFYRTRRPDKPGPPVRPDWPTKRTPELYQAFDLPCGGLGVRGEGGGGGVMGPGGEWEESNAKHPNNDITSTRTDRQGQRTELLPIKLEVLVGKGRFAEVWRGCLLQGETGGVNSYETVAVKVFPAVEYVSWRNECSIFSDPKMEHDNVVRFLAAEERGPPGHALRKYWLVLAYHDLGNVQDFLTANTLSWEELVAMAGSIARGLAHLHSDTTPSGVPKCRPCGCRCQLHIGDLRSSLTPRVKTRALEELNEPTRSASQVCDAALCGTHRRGPWSLRGRTPGTDSGTYPHQGSAQPHNSTHHPRSHRLSLQLLLSADAPIPAPQLPELLPATTLPRQPDSHCVVERLNSPAAGRRKGAGTGTATPPDGADPESDFSEHTQAIVTPAPLFSKVLPLFLTRAPSRHSKTGVHTTPLPDENALLVRKNGCNQSTPQGSDALAEVLPYDPHRTAVLVAVSLKLKPTLEARTVDASSVPAYHRQEDRNKPNTLDVLCLRSADTSLHRYLPGETRRN